MAHGMDELREDKLEHTFGKQVYKDHKRVVRVKEVDGKLRVFVHKHDSKGELTPRGYWAGSNYLEAE